MSTISSIVAAALMLTAATAVAQDLPATQLEDHAQVVRQDALTRALLRQRNRSHRERVAVLSPQARATCANKRRAEANLGANHPKVRQLYALCARAGY